MQLASPTIVEELSVCSRFVRTKNQLKGARVDILIDGLPGPVGGGIADWPDQWFGLDPGVSLAAGQLVRARQSLGGDVSPPPPPSIGVTVQDRSVATPQYVAPLVACSKIAVVSGFAPGATVTVADAAGTVLGTETAAGGSVVVRLSRAVVSEVLTATSSACGAASSAPVQSLQAEPTKRTPDGHLLAPLLASSVFPCMRILHFTNTQIGATLHLNRKGGVTTWDITATELYARIDPPLEQSEVLTFWQDAPNTCQVGPSDKTTVTVSAGPPPAPWIAGQPCPGSRMIQVDGLVPSATVKIVSGASDLLVFEAAEESADVDLAGVTLTPGQQLTVVQGLCKVFGPPSPVPIAVTQAQLDAVPLIPEHLVACAGVVRVAGVAEGAFVEVYSEFLKGRIGHGLASDRVIDILVSPTLLPPNAAGKKDHIHAEVGGCARGTAWREVDPAPDIPPFFVDTPRARDRSVSVHNLVPGCVVDVSVAGQWANEVWVASEDARVPVPAPLQQGQSVDVNARLCRQQRSAPTVTVAAPLDVIWEQPSGAGIERSDGSHVSGRVQAALALGPDFGNLILIGTEAGGVWTVQPGGPSFPFSLDWAAPMIWCLAHGTRGSKHLFCGTNNGLMETDPTDAVPLVSWQAVSGVPAGPGAGPGANVNDVLVLPGHNVIVIATDSGIWWSSVPPTTATGYVWISASYVATGSYKSLCEGPNESVVAYRMGAPGGGFLLGTWNPAGGLSWAETTPGLPADIVEGMANGAVTSCAGNRSRMYAALEDSKNHEWLAVLRSDNGGQSWYLPYKDPARTALKAMGSQADDNLCIAAHPTNAEIVLLAGRRDGVLGSFHGATDWDLGKWPEFPGNFHGDSRCLAFDPNDPDSNTVFAGGDGGFFVSHDLAVSWDSSCNTVLPTLVFDGIDTPPTSTHALTASPAYPGVLAGGLVDNGEVYLAADGEPWRQLSDGDGSRAVFITPDVLLHAGNEDTVGLKWAQWNGKSFNPSVNSRPPSYPDGTAFLPILGRVTYPDYRDPGDGALLLAMGGETNGDVYGIFDNGAATDPASDRFSWKKLTTAADYVTGLGSLTGRSILIGTVHAHLYQFDPATGSLIELVLPTGLGDHPVRWIKVAAKSQAFCLVDNNVLRTTNMVSWVKASTIANTTLEVLEVDRALDPVGLFVAGSGGAWLSRDFGDTWEATKGLPRTPHANHLEVVDWGLAGRAIHLGTWNWSVWRASLT